MLPVGSRLLLSIITIVCCRALAGTTHAHAYRMHACIGPRGLFYSLFLRRHDEEPQYANQQILQHGGGTSQARSHTSQCKGATGSVVYSALLGHAHAPRAAVSDRAQNRRSGRPIGNCLRACGPGLPSQWDRCCNRNAVRPTPGRVKACRHAGCFPGLG